MRVLHGWKGKTDLTEMNVAAGRKECGVWTKLCVLEYGWCFNNLQGAALQAQINKYIYTHKLKNDSLLKDADSMTIIRDIASYSMSKRWKRNCTILSNPLLSIYFCFFVSSFFRNLASCGRMFLNQLRDKGVFWVLLNCSCTTRLVDVCDPIAAPKHFSF